MFDDLPTREIQGAYAAAAQFNRATRTSQMNYQVALARRSGNEINLAQRAKLLSRPVLLPKLEATNTAREEQ